MRVLEKSRIERPVVAYARRKGIFVTKMELPHYRGMPDDVLWMRGGSPVLIEFKAPGCVPEPLQQLHIDRLRGLGYCVFVVDDAAVGRRIIDALCKETDDGQDKD